MSNVFLRLRSTWLPPRFSAVVELLCALVAAVWFFKLHSPMLFLVWLAVRCLWFGVVIMVTRYPSSLSRLCHWLSLIIFQIGFLILLLIIDQTSSFGVFSFGWYLLLAGGSVIPAGTWYAVPSVRSELVFMARPHTRLGIALLIFGLGGIWAGVGALATFNLYQPLWWLVAVAVASLVSTLAAGIGWRWYGAGSLRSQLLASSILAWCMLQLGLMMLVWPIGFLFLGLLMAWAWYCMWLTIRYYLSDDGITWRRHAYFIAFHSGFIAFILAVIIRWR